MQGKRILLVHMPFGPVAMPNLGIERLAAILRQAALTVDVLYGTLLFEAQLPTWLEHHGAAPLMFAPVFYDEDAQTWSLAFQKMSELSAVALRDGKKLDTLFDDGNSAARKCIERCMEVIAAGNYDVVGLSIGFDAQRLPSLALANQIKKSLPALPVIAGGTACDDEMGITLFESFGCLDGVLSGEADQVITKAVQSIFDPNAVVPSNFLLRGRQHTLIEKIETPSLNELPLPNFDSFNAQLAKSTYAGKVTRVVLHEGSRGCWYGQKNHCTFCGIRSVDQPYRAVDSERLVSDIAQLQKKWTPDLIYLTDAILSRDAFNNVLPELRRMKEAGELQAALFVETKSNLTPTEVMALADANIQLIQPGIENFLTSTLKNMRKGVTGVQQIELLKWCAAFHLKVLYSILLNTPGESAEDRLDLVDIIGQLCHLPAPSSAVSVTVHRFSPYFKQPANFGIARIMPFDYQRLLYRLDDTSLLRLCYEFDHRLFDSSRNEDDSAARVGVAVRDWQTQQRNGAQLRYFAHEEGCTIVRIGDGAVQADNYTGLKATILHLCHRAISINTLHNKCWPAESVAVNEALDQLIENGVVLQMDNRILNVAVPDDPRKIIRTMDAALIQQTIPIRVREPQSHACT